MGILGPFVGVSAIVVRDEPVVVGRRRGSHGAGSWAFPGGKVDPVVEVASGEPVVREPGKVESWRWVGWDEGPEPGFAPAASLLATGWRPGAEPVRGGGR